MTPELQALVSCYKDAKTEFEKAKLEQAIWDNVQDRSLERRKYLHALISAPPNETDLRSSLLRGMPASEPLWERVHLKTMPLSTASKILRHAKEKARRSPKTLAEIVKQAVEEYDNYPFTVRLPGGWTMKRKASTDLPNLEDAPFVRRSQGSADDSDRLFWKSIREMVAAHVATRLKGTDPIVANQVYKRFEVDLKILLDEFGDRISRAATGHRDAFIHTKEAINRPRIRQACLILAIDPPNSGRPVDLDKASKQKKRLAKLYHPDSHGGDESMREKYHEVLGAYQLLEDYNETIKKERPSGEAPNNGGSVSGNEDA
jgi:hypothetical protein